MERKNPLKNPPKQSTTNHKLRNRPIATSRRYIPNSKLPATAPPDLPHLEPRLAEIALHHKLGQLAEQAVRDRVRQLLGRVGEFNADAKGGEVDVARVHYFDAAVKVLGHEGGLDGDDGGEVVAFGEEVLVFGEVDGVGCVHGYYFYGGVSAEGGVGVGVGVVG